MNHGNLIKVLRTTGNLNGPQSEPIGNTINLNNKNFTKEVQKLLNAILTLFQPLKKSFKKVLIEKMNNFCKHLKLKANFRDNTSVKEKIGLIKRTCL